MCGAERTRAGISLSGGAQHHVPRLDFGPMIETRLPLGPAQPRLVVEWCQRVAGHARHGRVGDPPDVDDQQTRR